MKFPIRILAASIAIAGFATAADAQMASNNMSARGNHSSYFFRSQPQNEQPRADPVNSPAANPMSRPVARFGPVTPVPEPSEWAMMLAGLALVGFIVKRNSKRS